MKKEGSSMTQNNKPEWFEITDADEKPELRKVSKSLPAGAALVVALILGVGAVTTQTQNDTPASATSASAEQTPAVDTSPTAKVVSTAKAVSTAKSVIANPVTAAAVGATAATKLVNPSISKLPKGGGDDDDEGDDHHGRGHDDEDDDEGDDD
jgi:hypothetical protein